MKKILIAAVAALVATPCIAQLKQHNIVDYGAKINTLSTRAIQTAVDACNANGGGDVVVPTGVFLMGTVHLKSNVHLYLQSGAILRGSANLNDYEPYKPDTPYVPIHIGMFLRRMLKT